MSTVKIFRGDTWQRVWLIETSEGVPANLTGASARLHVRDEEGALAMSASTVDGRLTFGTITQGRIDLVMPKEVTDLPLGKYRFDLEVTFPNGTRITYEQKTLLVMEDISHD